MGSERLGVKAKKEASFGKAETRAYCLLEDWDAEKYEEKIIGTKTVPEIIPR